MHSTHVFYSLVTLGLLVAIALCGVATASPVNMLTMNCQVQTDGAFAQSSFMGYTVGTAGNGNGTTFQTAYSSDVLATGNILYQNQLKTFAPTRAGEPMTIDTSRQFSVDGAGLGYASEGMYTGIFGQFPMANTSLASTNGRQNQIENERALSSSTFIGSGLAVDTANSVYSGNVNRNVSWDMTVSAPITLSSTVAAAGNGYGSIYQGQQSQSGTGSCASPVLGEDSGRSNTVTAFGNFAMSSDFKWAKVIRPDVQLAPPTPVINICPLP